jgi:GT2 family glycosyltransferase
MDLIIVNYKSTNYLKRCLGSVYQSLNGTKTNVYVFDNGSGDHVDQIKASFPQVNLLKHNRNLGFSRAVNIVSQKSSSAYIVFLNPDTLVTNGVFKSVKIFMDANPDVAIIGPKILDPDGCVQGSARAFPTFRSVLAGRRSLIVKLFPNSRIACASILSNNSDGKTPMEVDWVSGACMFVRREALDEVGLFDERFFLYWEDIDLCKRMAAGGWKVIYYPLAAVEHAVGGSSERNLVRSVFEFHKSAYIYFMKHLKSNGLILRSIVILGLSARFCFVIFSQMIRRTMIKFHNKSKTILKAISDLPK